MLSIVTRMNTTGHHETQKARLWVRIDQYSQPWPKSATQWRQLLRNRDKNGLAPFVSKIGNAILIDELGIVREWIPSFAGGNKKSDVPIKRGRRRGQKYRAEALATS
jgi:hypothetical protein